MIPSDTFDGKGLGPAIDSADCVVRFNAHGPFNCSDPLDGSDPKCPDTSDYGARDDVRFVNANPEMLDRLETDPCVSSIGGADPTCKRVIVTWLDGSTHESQFFSTHAIAEAADGLFRSLGIGDLNEVIHEYAFKYSQPKPCTSLRVHRDERPEGSEDAVASRPRDPDGDARADGGYATRRTTPSPLRTTTSWSTTITRRRCATAARMGTSWSRWRIRTTGEGSDRVRLEGFVDDTR